MDSIAAERPIATPLPGAPQQPTRVLHVVGRMRRGGVETWLMNILRVIDRSAYQIDFLVHEKEPGEYDEEIRRLGSEIIVCPAPTPFAFARNFRRVLAARPAYDVVHSHVHAYSGWVLRVAARAGVPARVAHIHTDRSNVPSEQTLVRRLYGAVMRQLVRRYATAGVAVSIASASAFFGEDWRKDRRWRIIYYGIDLARLVGPQDRAGARFELGIPADAIVVGHVGNLLPVKNHKLLIEMAAEMIRRRTDGALPLRFLLVGDGPLRLEMEARASASGVRGHVVFAGTRPDVPRMLAAMDVFVFPSLWEGLPLSVVEAQAAGLRMVVSDRVTDEATAVPELVLRLSPDAPAVAWADACLAAYKGRAVVSREEAFARVEAGKFNVSTCLRELISLYSAAGSRPAAAAGRI